MNKKTCIPKSKSITSTAYTPPWLSQLSIKQVSWGAKALYSRLVQWSGDDGIAFRSKNDLKDELGISLRTLGDLIKELKDLGLINTFQPIKGGVSHYIFYDHEWMHLPIIKQLEYKSDRSNVVQHPANLVQNNVTNSAESCTNQMQDSAHINKINKNNKKNIIKYNTKKVFQSPVDNFSKDEFETDFPQTNNQTLVTQCHTQKHEQTTHTTKSDYFEKQTNCKTMLSKNKLFSVNDILSDNPYQIPEKYIHKWAGYRKDNKNPVDEITWEITKKQLAQCKEQGKDPIEAFESMVVGNWPSLKTEWPKNNVKPEPFYWTPEDVIRA